VKSDLAVLVRLLYHPRHLHNAQLAWCVVGGCVCEQKIINVVCVEKGSGYYTNLCMVEQVRRVLIYLCARAAVGAELQHQQC
jgi:hypothetical protein